jgi:TetR/AcrR family transcriptional repressor of nem operon
MPLSKAHKARTHARILDVAGRLFRTQGYGATGIDRLMGAADLTRGGFYAHFRDKEAVLIEVLQADRGLPKMLRARDGATRARLRQQAVRVFADYLYPGHQREVATGCNAAALAADAARAGPRARAAYRALLVRIAAELLRAPGEDAALAWRRANARRRRESLFAVALATGAVATARALDGSRIAGELLREALACALPAAARVAARGN